MTPDWVARLPIAEAAVAAVAAVAARLRTQQGVRSAIDHDSLWLCVGHGVDAAVFRQQLPEATIFDVQPDHQLVPSGHLVPTGRLPELDWRPLSEVLTVEVPAALHAGRPVTRAALSLVPSSVEQTPNVLLTSLELWADYALKAPQVRLDRWRFAVSPHNDVIIRGEPLPPLPGRLFIEQSGLACPAGWTWTPAVDADVLREMLGMQPDDLAVMDAEKRTPLSPPCDSTTLTDVIRGREVESRSTVERIGDTESCSITLISTHYFVRATRSAIRASREAV